MALTHAPARLGPAVLVGVWGGGRVVSSTSDGPVRWSVVGVAALAAVAPVDAVVVTAASVVYGVGGDIVPALLATTFLLPPYLYLVTSAARGCRAAHAGWLLVAVTAVVLVATPAAGIGWLAAYGALGLAALLVLPPRWAAPVVVGILVAQFPLATALGVPGDGVLSALLVSKCLAVYLLVRLTAAARQLRETRALLAADAVVQERLRIDTELRRTVGADLAAIAEQGAGLSTVAEESEVAAQLTELVGRSRATLARARRLVGGYRHHSLRSELDTAATLLRAAGIPTLVHVPDQLPHEADDVRARLRAETSRLLRGARAGSCTLTVTVHGDTARLDVRTDEPARESA